VEKNKRLGMGLEVLDPCDTGLLIEDGETFRVVKLEFGPLFAYT
jgi:hypothetical protein